MCMILVFFFEDDRGPGGYFYGTAGCDLDRGPRSGTAPLFICRIEHLAQDCPCDVIEGHRRIPEVQPDEQLVIEDLPFDGKGRARGGMDDHGVPVAALQGGSGASERNKMTIKAPQDRSGSFCKLPGEYRAFEGVRGLRIGWRIAIGEMTELARPSLPDGFDQLRVAEADKEPERVSFAI